MKQIFKGLTFRTQEGKPDELVVGFHDAKWAVRQTVKDILEQIEEAKLSELGEVIEKLKQEYK